MVVGLQIRPLAHQKRNVRENERNGKDERMNEEAIGGQGPYVRGLRGEDSLIYPQDLFPAIQQKLNEHEIQKEKIAELENMLVSYPTIVQQRDEAMRLLEDADWLDECGDHLRSYYRRYEALKKSVGE